MFPCRAGRIISTDMFVSSPLPERVVGESPIVSHCSSVIV